MLKQITVGDYLLTRLKELGIKHIFGVPGDYNLEFLDQIEQTKGLQWIGNCNELNAAYAADGYARIHGIGALVTTFGVGELSAINGIAGSYAELIPVVHITGTPSTLIRHKHAIVHHTLGDGRFNVFADIYKSVTVAQADLNEKNAAHEIDRVLRECWIKKRPVYINLPSDTAFKKIKAPSKPLNLNFPLSNLDAIHELSERAAKMIKEATAPVILLDACAQHFPMKSHILAFLKATGIPFATMNMAKAIIDESHPQFIGSYAGEGSVTEVKNRIEKSDCVITFGTLLSDFNTGGFTTKINVNAAIEIHSYYTNIQQSLYTEVMFCDVIPALTKKLQGYRYKDKIHPAYTETPVKIKKGKITQSQFWNVIPSILEKNSIILAEIGTSIFGSLQMKLPNNTTYIGQPLWSSIGYTVGGLLGACLAAPKRRAILFIGDGSFQLTAQELSTLIRQRLTPTIFLLNNQGYTIERAIHGEKMKYNDIQSWDYQLLPKVFGNNVWSIKVENTTQLQAALKQLKKHSKKLKFIEVKMAKLDYPEALRKLSKHLSESNY